MVLQKDQCKVLSLFRTENPVHRWELGINRYMAEVCDLQLVSCILGNMLQMCVTKAIVAASQEACALCRAGSF